MDGWKKSCIPTYNILPLFDDVFVMNYTSKKKTTTIVLLLSFMVFELSLHNHKKCDKKPFFDQQNGGLFKNCNSKKCTKRADI